MSTRHYLTALALVLSTSANGADDPSRPIRMLTGFIAGGGSDIAAHTVREFIDLAKAQPGKLNYGSSGIGGSNHVVTEIFASAAGIKLTHLPFKGPTSRAGGCAR